MKYLRGAVAGWIVGLAVGALTGTVDVLIHRLNPALGLSARLVLAVVMLYAQLWSVGGLGIGLLVATRAPHAAYRIPLAVLCGLSVFIVASGYTNLLVLRAGLRPQALLIYGVILSMSGAVTAGLLRSLPDWGDRRVLPLTGLIACIAVIGAALVTYPPGRAVHRSSAAARSTQGPNIIVVLFDSLRADHTSLYGYSRPTTPALDRFAHESAVFLNTHAQSSWTKASVATIFTGVYPERHQCNSLAAQLPDDLVTLPMVLQKHGYRTALFSGNPLVSPIFGYARGVDHVLAPVPARTTQTILGNLLRVPSHTTRIVRLLDASTAWTVPQGHSRRGTKNGGALTTAFLAWLNTVGDHAFFAYVHFFEPHFPYTAPPPFDGQFRGSLDPKYASLTSPPHNRGIAPFGKRVQLGADDTAGLIANYDERIAYADGLLDRILTALRQSGRLANTAVLVIADHGEEFGEHGIWRHGQSLYESVIRVPFLLYYPRRVAAGSRVVAPVRLIDVPSTVLDLAGITPPDQFEGRSVLPVVDGSEAVPRATLVQLNYHGQQRIDALMSGGLKVIRAESGSRKAVQLFDLQRDPGEEHDLASAQAEERTRMIGQLDTAVGNAAPHGAPAGHALIDPGTKDRLRALGYEE